MEKQSGTSKMWGSCSLCLLFTLYNEALIKKYLPLVVASPYNYTTTMSTCPARLFTDNNRPVLHLRSPWHYPHKMQQITDVLPQLCMHLLAHFSVRELAGFKWPITDSLRMHSLYQWHIIGINPLALQQIQFPSFPHSQKLMIIAFFNSISPLPNIQ